MQQTPRFPSHARLPINRCNLPADILGSISFQLHPQTLVLDGVAQLHRDLFDRLDGIANATQRAETFCDYITVYFRLHTCEDIGYAPDSRIDRRRADYRNILKGWFFNSDSLEGAVLKSWVESRFGLLTRFHKQRINSTEDKAYTQYMEDRCSGLYNTNALESQLDLVYTYCQYELKRHKNNTKHLTLYRGINNVDEFQLVCNRNSHKVLLLNNINSFSSNPDRASEFGDNILIASVPFSKVFYYSGLLPVRTQGEDEVIVIGGLYQVDIKYHL